MKRNTVFVLMVAFCLSSNAFGAETMYGLFMVTKGDVKITNLKNEITAAKVGSKILPGETVSSGVDSRAKIVMSDRNVINISPSTQLKIEKYENNSKTGEKNAEMNLIEGKVRNNVEQKYDGNKSKFIIKTPTAVAGVRGTQFVTSFNSQTRITQVVTLSGSVTLAPLNAKGVQTSAAVVVKKGESTTMSAGQAPEPPKTVPREELKKMDSETTPTAQNNSGSNDRMPASGSVSSSMVDNKDKDPGQAPVRAPDNAPPDSKIPLVKAPIAPVANDTIKDIIRNNSSGKTQVIIRPIK